MKRNDRSRIFAEDFFDMITLISGTNRPDSWTRKVADVYKQRLQRKGVEFAFFDLVDMPQNMLNNTMYDSKHPDLKTVEENYLNPASAYIFVVPEYNGSYPGILKAFIDASDVRQGFHNKKAAIVGVADGRAGNLRGMDDLTNVLNHMKINVLHLKIPVSSVRRQFDDNGEFIAEETLKLIDAQIDLLQAL